MADVRSTLPTSIDVGLAIPAHLPEFDPATIPSWARAIEDANFSTLMVSDRLAWPTPEPLAALAAAAAVTTRIRLLTSVLLAPLRSNPALFAAEAATVDAVAGPGRLRLGLAPGARQADYAVSGLDFARRGPLFDHWLDEVRGTWAGTTGTDVGPTPVTPGGPALLFGGSSAPALRRASSHGIGWVSGGQSSEEFAVFAPRVRHAFDEAGRTDPPVLSASVMSALGSDRHPAGTGVDAVRGYYAGLGADYAEQTAERTVTDAETLRDTVDAFAAAGANEIVFILNHLDIGAVNRLRTALGD